jgi:hypothetical protein
VIVMTLDELEAVRLADLDGLYQEQASEKMGVSRSTFSRIVEAAHRKVAQALVHGKALKIEGGPVLDAGARGVTPSGRGWQNARVAHGQAPRTTSEPTTVRRRVWREANRGGAPPQE